MSAPQIVRAKHATIGLAFAFASLVGCTPETSDKAAQAVDKASEEAERRLERAAAVFDDATITAKVKTALLAKPQLKALAIDVDTAQAVVSLNGTVANDQERKEAESVARQIEGVKEVRNNLHVRKS